MATNLWQFSSQISRIFRVSFLISWCDFRSSNWVWNQLTTTHYASTVIQTILEDTMPLRSGLSPRVWEMDLQFSGCGTLASINHCHRPPLPIPSQQCLKTPCPFHRTLALILDPGVTASPRKEAVSAQTADPRIKIRVFESRSSLQRT